MRDDARVTDETLVGAFREGAQIHDYGNLRWRIRIFRQGRLIEVIEVYTLLDLREKVVAAMASLTRPHMRLDVEVLTDRDLREIPATAKTRTEEEEEDEPKAEVIDIQVHDHAVGEN
jgi:hypothetical protein